MTRPVVFFYGAEFAPYAAAQRWPVIVALSRFGTFGTVGLMQSSESVAFSNTSTFTFWHATYTSKWIDLQTVERYSALEPHRGPVHGAANAHPPPGGGGVDLRRHRARRSPCSTSPTITCWSAPASPPRCWPGQSQSQIVGDLAIPTSPITQAIVASANEITATICAVTGQQPAAVCHARGVTAARAKLRIYRRAARSADQLARRSSTTLRSTSFSPPQIPWGSRMRMAYSRQSPRT